MAKASSTTLHSDSIVIDAVCPLVMDNSEYLDWYITGGVTAIAPSVGSTESAPTVLTRLARWHRLIRERDDIVLVRSAADIIDAKQQGRLGVYFHLQGTDPVENNLDLIDLYKSLGVGMIQLTYNERNRVGDGCEEPGDAGLSRFGARLVDRLHKAQILVDCSHVGERTALDAIERSTAPVVLSHSNSKSLHPVPRNASDELICKIAATGGVIGIAGFPGMIGASSLPSIDQFIAHIDYVVGLVGIDHVGLGLDYFSGQAGVVSDEAARAGYEKSIAEGIWTMAYPPPPHHFPTTIETPESFQNVTRALENRGYQPADAAKILGGNWLRVFEAVWKSPSSSDTPL